MKYLMIINPNAGNAKKIEDKLIDYFARKGKKLDVVETKKPLHAQKIATSLNGKYDVVIAAGGDGTINEVINGLMKEKNSLKEKKLGIIPLGTENALAQGLGISFDPISAARVIIKDKSKQFDLGLVSKGRKKRYFILTAGIGLDAKALQNNKPIVKKLLGKHSYGISAIQTVLTHVPTKLEIWLDDQILPRWGYFVVIANVKHYGGVLELAHYAEPDDGYLDVCIFKRTDLVNMSSYFLSAATKGLIPLDENPNMEYFRVKNIKIKSKKKVMAHVDAELIGDTPITFNVIHKAIRVIC